MTPIRRKLLAWFHKNGRDYPWRKTENWFHLLMAEMMLRRTRADQVLGVYENFTGRFETPEEASRINPEELSELLRPLGLAWRARQLHGTIQYLKDSYHKRAPRREDDLKSIPGVGDYSEAMLRNRLFGERVAAVDSNVARFMARLDGRPHHSESRRNRELNELAGRFAGTSDSKELNLAIIDLSALICRPRSPLCSEFPLCSLCETGKKNTEKEIAKGAKKREGGKSKK